MHKELLDRESLRADDGVTPISSKELRVFFSGDFINLFEQEEDILSWSSESASFHCS